MAYMWKGKCPASHPVPVPALATKFSYPIRGGNGLELASGGLYSGHADFINAWYRRRSASSSTAASTGTSTSCADHRFWSFGRCSR